MPWNHKKENNPPPPQKNKQNKTKTNSAQIIKIGQERSKGLIEMFNIFRKHYD